MRTNVYSGQYLSNLTDDITQGPAAAGGAIAGAILRLHTCCATSTYGKVPSSGFNARRVAHRCGRRRLPSPQPVIDQVFVSTCIQTSRKPSDLAQTCLTAAYEGAAERQSRKLVLTAVGGSFQNNTRQIAEAMLRAHESVGPSVRSSFQFTWPDRLRSSTTSSAHPTSDARLPCSDRLVRSFLWRINA